MKNRFAILFGIWISAIVGCIAVAADTNKTQPDIDISLNELYQYEFDYNGASYFRLYPEYRGFIYDRPACREQLGEKCHQFLMCKDKSFDLCLASSEEEWYMDSKKHAITE